MNNNYNKIPDIDLENSFTNPTLTSPNSYLQLSFYLTRDSALDVETYKRFLDNAISRFRRSRTYKNYKHFLMDLGLNKCQFHGNINGDMATIEMHHQLLTIFDIAVIITEHVLNTKGYISTFDLVQLLKQEHKQHRVQLVMLSLTPHQLFHNNPDFFIHPKMCFGNWTKFLEIYNKGITQDIAFKLIFYLKRAIEEGESNDHELLTVRNQILNWSYLNNQLV